MMCVGQMDMVPTINTICYVKYLKYFSIKILTKICNKPKNRTLKKNYMCYFTIT